jgi:hypothetical protein
MNNPDEKEFYEIQRNFFIHFIIGSIYFLFFIYFAATFGQIGFLQPVILNPLLLVLSVITCSFAYAALLWDREMRKFQRRRKC